MSPDPRKSPARAGGTAKPSAKKPSRLPSAQRGALIAFAVVLAGLFAGFAVAQGIGQPSVPSDAVAVVKDAPSGLSPISKAQFARAFKQQASSLPKPPKPSSPQYDDVKKAAIDSLLDTVWIQGEAEDLGIEPTAREVQAQLKTIKGGFGSDAAFLKFIKQSGYTPQDVTDRGQAPGARDRDRGGIAKGVPPVTNSDIQDFYNGAQEQFQLPATRDVRLVLNRDRAKVEQAKTALEADSSTASWNKIAKQYSTDPASKDNGGLRPGLTDGLVEEPLNSKIFAASLGTVSGPVKTPLGWYVFQVAEGEPGDDAAAEGRAEPDSQPALFAGPDAGAQQLRRGLPQQVEVPDLLRLRLPGRALRQLQAQRPPAERARRLLRGESEEGHPGRLPGPGATARPGPPGHDQPARPDGREAAAAPAPARPAAALLRAGCPARSPAGCRPASARRPPRARMGSPQGSAAAVARLDEITRRLRRECPWDREQDERSIVPHTVEEAYELADAAERGDDARLLDELGDVLFQVHFLALLLEERGAGDLAAVAEHCREKLIRRHPHIFPPAPPLPSGREESDTDSPALRVRGRRGRGTPWTRLGTQARCSPTGTGSRWRSRARARRSRSPRCRRTCRRCSSRASCSARAANRAGGPGLAPDALEAAGRARQALSELEAAAAGGSTAALAPSRKSASGSSTPSARRSLRSSTPPASSIATPSWRCAPPRSATASPSRPEVRPEPALKHCRSRAGRGAR